MAAPIQLSLDNGIDQIASILGVSKAGNFFVLLEPASPKVRSAEIVKELHADVALSDHQNIELARQVTSKNYKVILSGSADVHPATESPGLIIKPIAIADIRYTSKSGPV